MIDITKSNGTFKVEIQGSLNDLVKELILLFQGVANATSKESARQLITLALDLWERTDEEDLEECQTFVS